MAKKRKKKKKKSLADFFKIKMGPYIDQAYADGSIDTDVDSSASAEAG